MNGYMDGLIDRGMDGWMIGLVGSCMDGIEGHMLARVWMFVCVQ